MLFSKTSAIGAVGNRKTRTAILAVIVAFVSFQSTVLKTGAAFAQSGAVTVKTLEEPRFRSLKSDRVNVRRGPGMQYPIAWVFRRIGMPVEVLREFDHWRQIRDSDGALGWVYRGLLAARRTALVVPWQAGKNKQPEQDPSFTAIRVEADASSRVVAFAEPGTIASVRECDGRWCRIIVEPFEGWIEQAKLWGVYDKERIAR